MVLACPHHLHTTPSILKSVPSLPWKMPFESGIRNKAGYKGGGLEKWLDSHLVSRLTAPRRNALNGI